MKDAFTKKGSWASKVESSRPLPSVQSQIRVNTKDLPKTAETKNTLNTQNSHMRSLNTQKKNFDEAESGDLELNIMNKARTHRLLSLTCTAPSELNGPGLALSKAFSGSTNESNPDEKKLMGSITIKIYEDILGKRSYDLMLDTKHSSGVKRSQSDNVNMFNWTGGNHKAPFLINLNRSKIGPISHRKKKTFKKLKENYPCFTSLTNIKANKNGIEKIRGLHFTFFPQILYHFKI